MIQYCGYYPVYVHRGVFCCGVCITDISPHPYEECGLMGVIWKVVLVVVNFWIGEAVDFHGMLHCFRSDRGTVTDSLEVNLFDNLTKMKE